MSSSLVGTTGSRQPRLRRAAVGTGARKGERGAASETKVADGLRSSCDRYRSFPRLLCASQACRKAKEKPAGAEEREVRIETRANSASPLLSQSGNAPHSSSAPSSLSPRPSRSFDHKDTKLTAANRSRRASPRERRGLAVSLVGARWCRAECWYECRTGEKGARGEHKGEERPALATSNVDPPRPLFPAR